MGLFNPNATLTADLNLLFQIVIFIFLVVGMSTVKVRRRFRKHGTVMGIAVALNMVSMVVVMIPALLGFGGLFSMPLTRPALVVVTHAIMGTLVEILGIWIVGTWVFSHHEIKACGKKKNVMRATTLLWLIELFLGIYIYIMLYLPI